MREKSRKPFFFSARLIVIAEVRLRSHTCGIALPQLHGKLSTSGTGYYRTGNPNLPMRI
jgi:hypothetical protein